ncbi:MAG: hypothetical protein IKQ45_04830 [Clostridia bacterium]|nr:hypothetical protein [Clostridia bacterium]
MVAAGTGIFRKALKTIVPSTVGMIAGLVFVALVMGTDAAVRTIIPVLVGILCGFAAVLYFAKKEGSGKDR